MKRANGLSYGVHSANINDPWHTDSRRFFRTKVIPHLRDEDRVVKLILDNLNTHKLASLSETFSPPEARRIARKLELHYTPKHGSWLNMAELELRMLFEATALHVVG